MPGVHAPFLVLLVGGATVLLRESQRISLKKNIRMTAVSGPLEAVAFVLRYRPSMVICSQALSGMRGTEVLLLINLLSPRSLCVLATFRKCATLSSDLADLETDEQINQIASRYSMRPSVCRVALTMAQATDHRDQHSRAHSERVSAIAHHIGRKMDLNGNQLEDILVASLLRDFGMIGIPDDMLTNRGELTTDQKRKIRKHPGLGAWITKTMGFSRSVSDIVAQHHENHDGSGYPAGRRAKQISLAARILRVADSFEAMRGARSFRPARNLAWIQDEFKRCRGIDFDPDVTDVLLGELKTGQLDTLR